MSRFKFLKLCILFVLVLIVINSFVHDFEEMAETRHYYAGLNEGDIKIVAIQDYQKSNYVKGIRLAVEEINSSQEKLLGRDISLDIVNEGRNFEESKPLIRRIASDPEVTAVLGHRKSSIAIPASVIYEKSQVVFLSSFATSKMLTGHNFQYVFRMTPNNEVMAKQLASVAHLLNYQDVVILYARNDDNRELAFVFEEASVDKNINLVKRASFFDGEQNFRPIISQFNNEPFDAVFIASGAESAARLTKQLREMGIEQPILGNESLNSLRYSQISGKAGNKTILPSLYHEDQNNPLKLAFKKKYQAKYQEVPDHNAAQGYDSMKLMAAAISRAGATTPSLISSTLHFMPAWVGVTGIHAFDTSGEMQGKKYYFQTWRGGKLSKLPAVHASYLLSRFQSSLAPQDKLGNKVTDFPRQLIKRMHDDDHKTYLLDLAHEILRFKKIGIIFDNTEIGRKASGHNLLTELAKRKDIKIIGCEVPFTLLDKVRMKKSLVDCYGKLSLSSDAILVSTIAGADQTLIKRLNSGLTFFKIPTISLDPRNELNNVTLSLTKRTDIDKHSSNLFNGILQNQKIHEFSEELKGIPDIKVNLDMLQYIGQTDDPVLKLSPDVFLHQKISLINGENKQ